MKKFIAPAIVALITMGGTPTIAQDQLETGNVIFFHPDGSGLNHWNAGRMYWEGPDGNLNWDMLPEIAVYRGHMQDRLTGTSHGGATVHAFGYKMFNDSFGKDGTRSVNSLSGFEGTIMREAGAAGMPIGLVNDGDISEPGTAVFVSEVDDRDDSEEIARQILDGRPGFEGEARPQVILAGGEAWFLPADTPKCEADAIALDCYVHTNPFDDSGPTREDDRNLLQEFADAGYVVVRTRAEFEALQAQIDADPGFAPLVLGLFARDDIFNDETEEELLQAGLVDAAMADTREGRLILWGGFPDTPSYNPPTGAEMNAMALELLNRHSAAAELPFLLVSESESNDNLPNNANAIGMLNAVKRADDTIGVFREFIAENPDTMIITAADSDGGAPQVFSPAPVGDDGNVTVSSGNPTNIGDTDFGFPLDGIEGQATAPFTAAPNAFGDEIDFAIGWPGTDDVAGGIVSRAEGLNSELLRTEFRTQFDSTDVYRIMYATLFGELLPTSYGEMAPTRGE